jgi:prohibitin 1
MPQAFVLMVAIAFLVSGCGFTSTSPGEAVVFSRFGAVDMTCYPAGFYLYNPFTTSVYHVDVKVQKFEVKADASSRDLQDVHTTIVVNFSIDGTKCHEVIKNVGANFAQQIILPAVEEATKASTALFPVEKVIQERPKLKKEIEDGLNRVGDGAWIPKWLSLPSQLAKPPLISRSECARPSWQNSMATNCPQHVKPRA